MNGVVGDIPAGSPGFDGAASRRLLARLRDVMAGSGSGQERLDKIVTLIGMEMGADVCSCYVMRAGEVLELFSTLGLNQDAVHNTRLRVGEGIVGDIAGHARPIALDNAPSHPSFAYRPETGEDPFLSLAGVPILRGGKVRGVLVIQHKDRRRYTEVEVETLQTIAMVVAELVAQGELVNPQEVASTGDPALLPARLSGTSLTGGLAMGLAVIHRPQLTIRQMVSEDTESELARLNAAIATMHSAIDDLLNAAALAGLSEPKDILETYRMFAEDRGWLSRIREAIRMGLTAEGAVQQVQNDTRARMSHLTDPYIRERLLDLEDLTNRLLQHLAGRKSEADGGTLPEDIVLVARSMGPAELLDYDQRRLRGVILEEGSPSSHVCIVARALNIPVVQAPDALNRIEPLDPVIVDGDHGQAFVRPAEDIQMAFVEAVALRVRKEEMYEKIRALPSVTRDGVPISIQLNCGLLIDLPHLKASGAEGVGLYRTEIPFMVRSTYPDVHAQTDLYSRILDQTDDKPVVFRTLDVGGDKMLPYIAASEGEENPALGWRAIRIGLDHPSLLRQQLRALLRASAGRPLSVMFPMIAEVAEFDAARRLLDLEINRLKVQGGELPSRVRVGTMIEVPALLWQLPALLPRVDFLSVGSNDLTQYIFASDRGNPRTSGRYDPLSPAMLSLLRRLVEACGDANVPVSICGEMAGRPLDAMALIGIGFRTLSMSPPSVGPVKTMLRSLDVAVLRQYMNGLYLRGDHSLRDKLRSFAKDHGVII
ncbi:phosphoenolpyruvate--protein phosphotransferase [Azospirillum argentinense]|uniref:phosphoenolpyruvate--protein phosphotransferase n=1 Tax=Azospirillum argentinense TaxID=2970906 RepID=A0A5B0KLT5_9PROT|nr:phosphoenolpyruvate--protein phosphotransferase [Azospirillum argentinense]KAA1053627.1 Phosphoenolpyruvate-protein phosphotransferase, nitrogen regulation associated [Azospirillum argentinense]